MRYLFRKGLESNARSRFIHLDWGLWEKAQGQTENARSLFKRGHQLNALDAPLLQACSRSWHVSGVPGHYADVDSIWTA